jgi:hypothetical protein
MSALASPPDLRTKGAPTLTYRGKSIPPRPSLAHQRFTYMLYAADVLTGIQTALEPDSTTALRMARTYAKDGSRVEVWAGTPRHGVLVQVLG